MASHASGALPDGTVLPMTTPSSHPCHYLVATSSGCAYVRVVGLGSMLTCPPLREFLESLRQRGIQQFIFDLSDCVGFDSTFMGLLIGFSHAARRGDPASVAGEGRVPARSRVVVVNSSAHHRKLLESVGVNRVIELCSSEVAFPEIKLRRLKTPAVGFEQQLRQMIRSHESLIELDSSNEKKFGSFLEEVRKDLARNR